MPGNSEYQYNQFLPKTPSIGGTTGAGVDHVHCSFGFPNSELFLIKELAEAAKNATLSHGHLALHYPGGPGTWNIRQWIANRGRSRKIKSNPSDILITAGAGQAIDATARVLINPGDEVWVEAPSFFSALRAFEIAGAAVRAFPMDENGLQVDLVQEALEFATFNGGNLPKFIYVMPNFHNPGGVNLSVERRKQLSSLAIKYNFYILEDDAYADIHFNQGVLPAIYSFAPERVIYIGTFSKIIGPGIRLGWTIANSEILQYMRLFLLGSQTNPFMQEIIAGLLENIEFDKYLNDVNQRYVGQLDVMIHELGRYFGDEIKYNKPSGGFFLLVKFKEKVDVSALVALAEKKGVSVVNGKEFYLNGSDVNEIRLCFTYSSENQIRKGIERLAEAYKEMKHATANVEV
ncbi:PLP-dependent aminotransferase family protein [Bacillus sp. BRMEA1]|uniref:aminotransferase-like domain-containing protein n=1 Tax=Neobacillus endophyticus TaxID=2738405 RepID=UPI00156513FF|nr:PLP-dependent aminotransferase family protein [Neobacillus endophyticus]NRD79109.1 PLP-dependent aminotransferase family protein [Neobacillus endophyticus]